MFVLTNIKMSPWWKLLQGGHFRQVRVPRGHAEIPWDSGTDKWLVVSGPRSSTSVHTARIWLHLSWFCVMNNSFWRFTKFLKILIIFGHEKSIKNSNRLAIISGVFLGEDLKVHLLVSIFRATKTKTSISSHGTGWWFQPLWKILVKMGIFPKYGWT